MKYTLLILLFLYFGPVVFAQSAVRPTGSSVSSGDAFAAEKQLAAQVIDAHGGDKLRSIKTLTIIGSVDVTASSFPQAIPATFVMIFSGDKYRVEINNPFQPFKQVYDGTQTVSTIANGFTLPPLNRLGFPILSKIGTPGYVITAFGEGRSKKRGFRVTSPEGFYTDFQINEKTNQLKSYESAYNIQGRNVTTAVEIDRMKVVDGIVVPEKFVQRFDVGGMTIYGSFTAKQIFVNTPVSDDVFVLGR